MGVIVTAACRVGMNAEKVRGTVSDFLAVISSYQSVPLKMGKTSLSTCFNNEVTKLIIQHLCRYVYYEALVMMVLKLFLVRGKYKE